MVKIDFSVWSLEDAHLSLQDIPTGDRIQREFSCKTDEEKVQASRVRMLKEVLAMRRERLKRGQVRLLGGQATLMGIT